MMSEGLVREMISEERNEKNDTQLHREINAWVSSVFKNLYSEMKELPWETLYKKYHNNDYDREEISKKLIELFADPYVKDKRGICEYLLGRCCDISLLNIRVFDIPTKLIAYTKQTVKAREEKVSNCPLCAIGEMKNKGRIWFYYDMEADHVTPWKQGNVTSKDDCRMYCKKHNRAKGNR